MLLMSKLLKKLLKNCFKMSESDIVKNVSIRFKPGAYGAYRSMNNKIWYALSEFVDNAVQSYSENKEALELVEGSDFQLEIKIDVDISNDFIRVSDNAGGIDRLNFIRAFEPANIPTDISGLSEFGMGMKIAAIWFADKYTVKTKALGEDYERVVEFDLNKVMNEGKEDLEVTNIKSNKSKHYTTITLNELSHNKPTGNPMQLAKIREHVTSIYRKFINRGTLKLLFNGQELKFEEPEILFAPYVDDLKGESVNWKKEVNWEAGKYKVSGFIGLLSKMSSIHSGLSLFRRGRVIEGSHDQKYHPKILCGQPGSPRDKRLFGDLELEGFKVSFEKGKFLDTKEFDVFLGAIRDSLKSDKNDILKQGDKYRKGISIEDKKENAKKIAKRLVKSSQNTTYVFEKEDFEENLKEPEIIDGTLNRQNESDGIINFPINYDNKDYEVELELKNDSSIDDLYYVYPEENSNGITKLKATINLDHLFFEPFEKNFKKDIHFDPLIEIFRNLILAEVIARKQGLTNAGKIRKLFNQLISLS